MSRHAVIDIGTNSLKIQVAEREGGQLTVLLDQIEVTGLGRGLEETGLLAEEAMARSVRAATELTARARELGADEILAVGTMALRRAGNAADFIERVRRECGLAIEVISGDEEARLAHLAVLSGLPTIAGRLCIFDTGGGSTEFIFSEDDRVLRRFSVELGSRLSTDALLRSDPVTPSELAALARRRSDGLVELDPPVDELVGIGGTVTTLAAVMLKLEDYDADRVHGCRLGRGEVERQIELYRGLPVAERRRIVGLLPARADVILAGAAIVRAVMAGLGAQALTVSDRGLRYGLLQDRLFRRESP